MGTDFWTKEIKKYKENVCIALENIDSVFSDQTINGKIRPGYENIDVHIKFGINMDGKFNIKLKLVSDGHTTSPPLFITYSSVMFI